MLTEQETAGQQHAGIDQPDDRVTIEFGIAHCLAAQDRSVHGAAHFERYIDEDQNESGNCRAIRNRSRRLRPRSGGKGERENTRHEIGKRQHIQNGVAPDRVAVEQRIRDQQLEEDNLRCGSTKQDAGAVVRNAIGRAAESERRPDGQPGNGLEALLQEVVVRRVE